MKRPEKSSSADTVKTTVRIKRDLWKAVMHRSIDENRSFQEIVEVALDEYLHRRKG
jgi:hypothetical protein